SNISQAIQAFFANREPDDVLFLYYSGIGLWYCGWGGLLGLAAADTQPDEIQTTVPAYVLQGALRKCRSRKIVVMLDCRFGDRYPGGGAGASCERSSLIAQFQGEGRFVLVSCDVSCFSWEEERSIEIPDDPNVPPPLIRALVHGLKSGRADLDGNRMISVGEVFEFLEKEIAASAAEWRPCRWSFDQSKHDAVRIADAKLPGEDNRPTAFKSRYRVIQDIRLPLLDLIAPTYLLNKHFFFLDWNPAFDEVIAKPLKLVRGLHHAKVFVQALANSEDVVRHARETFGGERQALVDAEVLVFDSDRDGQRRYGTIRFQKLAAQIADEHGEVLGWSVSLNILEAGDLARLWEDIRVRIEEEVSWSRYAVVYDTLLLEFPEYLALIAQVTGQVGNARRCLDLGAGTGNGALRLLETKPDREVWAIEINETMLRHFRGKLDSIKSDSGIDYSDRLTILKDNILRLDALPAKSFDAAVMINVLYAIPDRGNCLRNVNRVLRPNGVLALSTPHRGTDVDRLFSRLREVLESKHVFEQYEEHFETARARHDAMNELIHRDTLDDLRAMLADAGFQVEQLIPDQYVGSVAVVRAVKAREVERRDPPPGTTRPMEKIETPKVGPAAGAAPPDAVPPDSADQRDVFVSYARDDSALADEIREYLEARKVRCWIAPRDIRPGMDWPTAIVHAIARCRIMVFVLTSRANQSDQAAREVAVAAEKRVPVVPVRVEDIPPSDGLALYLSNVHWLDAFPGPLPQHLPRLAETITALLSKMAGVAAEALGKGHASSDVLGP
ncbi:MAG: TIR domain-containing protein, partial [Planctomycetaceae bacterium]|nr:TIR domain-containing protein [Planctomycetaceae bacterium]